MNLPSPALPLRDADDLFTFSNLAETGVTIPDITAVIDTGKHREMR